MWPAFMGALLLALTSTQSFGQTEDSAGVIRAEFFAGKISNCSLLEMKDGSLLIVLTADSIGAFVEEVGSRRHWDFYFDSREVENVRRVLRYGSGEGPHGCIAN
jgi:hypothetical protein